MASEPLSAWKARVVEYLAAFPDMDGWEVGNEINGNWLGDDVLAKVAYAANAVKACCPTVPTVATLLWNLGEDSDTDAMFNWAATMPASLLAHVDVVGLSVYPEDHPLGTAFDRVVTTLHRRFPSQRIAVSELGYGNDDLSRTWWWGSRGDTASGRREVARLYDAASRAYPFSGGGTFWWYFLDEGDVR